MEHIQELKYEDKPDYDMLNDVFSSAMQRESIKDSDPFDWEKETSEEESMANQTLKTTLQMAGITGITTRAELLNQSQKNGLGATLGNQSLATPYGDHQNQMQMTANNNNNNNKNDQSNENNNINGNMEASYNYDVNGLENTNNNNKSTGTNKKIPKSLDRNAVRSKRNVASVVPSISNIDLQQQQHTSNTPNDLIQSSHQQYSTQRKSRIVEIEQKSLTSNNNNKPLETFKSGGMTAYTQQSQNANKQQQQQQVTKTIQNNFNQNPSAASAIAAAAAAVQNAASLAAGATTATINNHSYQNPHQQMHRLINSKTSTNQQHQSTKSKKTEDSQASLSVGSESAKQQSKLNLGTHQPIIMNSKQQPQQQQQPVTQLGYNTTNSSPLGNNSSFMSATPTTAGVALATTFNNNNNMNNNNKLTQGSSQGSFSYSNSVYMRQTSNPSSSKQINLNNSIDYTTPIGVTSSAIYQSPQFDMDLYQQNDSGI